MIEQVMKISKWKIMKLMKNRKNRYLVMMKAKIFMHLVSKELTIMGEEIQFGKIKGEEHQRESKLEINSSHPDMIEWFKGKEDLLNILKKVMKKFLQTEDKESKEDQL